MDQVITFDKSLQERLQEYQDFLPDDVSSKKQWSFYLELAMDPKGWQALWKIPRTTCESLKIPFPSVVLVLALDVRDMEALVRVLAVQDDDIHIPEKHYVPLTELWVTREQDKSIVLNLKSTANAIDVVRFFYTNLFMPWDLDDEDNDWKNKHLVSRLRFYYDMKNGNIPKTTTDHIISLVTEAKHLQAEREKYESELSESEGEDHEIVKNKNVDQLIHIHVRLLEIKSQFEILENPILRKDVIKRHSELMPMKNQEKQHTYLVFNEGNPDEYIQFLELVKQNYSDSQVTFVSSLAYGFEFAAANSIFLLNEFTHTIKNTATLESGAVLCGVLNRNTTIVTADLTDLMFDCVGDNIEIKNLTIIAHKPQGALLVRRGNVTLKNVKIIGDGYSSTHQAIIVLSGSKLELDNCEIQGFGNGIVGNSGAHVTIKNCDLHNLDFGLKIYDNCFVNLEKTTIHDCKDYGVVLETNNEDEKKYGTFDVLKIIPHIKVDDIKGHNNCKADVVISPKPQIKPVADLFANPDLDPTIIEDDAEMDECNVTVIEGEKKDIKAV